MSADLFAEFNSLSSNPPPPSTQPQASTPLPAQSQPQSQSQPPSQNAGKDNFGFFNTTSNVPAVTSSPVQPAQSWSSFQSQAPSSSSWGTFSTPAATTASSKPPVVAEEEEEDGWGDFEVASSAVAAPAPAPAPTLAQASGPAISSPIAWQSPVQPTTLSPSIPSSINWQTPVQTSPPTPSISPSISWQSTPPAPAQAPKPVVSQEDPVRTRIVRASTLDLMSNNLVDIASATQQPATSPWNQQPQPQLNQPFKAHAAHPSASQPLDEGTSRLRVKPKLKAGPSDPSVLFDAEDFELQVAEGDEDEDGEDEFGDFETVAPVPPSKPASSNPPPVKASPPPPSMDLLSLDDPTPSTAPTVKGKAPPSQLLGTLAFGATNTNYPQAPKSPSFQDRNPFPDLAIKTPTGPAPSDDKPKSASPVTAWPTVESAIEIKHEPFKDDDEGWGAWDDFPSTDNKMTKEKPQRKPDVDAAKPPESWDWDAVDNVEPSKPEMADDAPPPINVPPPSVILSVFPELLNTGDSLFKPISGQTASIKQRILSDPKAVDFVEGYILLATTAARVIAGRKQRWHRDKILAKSMSISAAGSKGMKLAGVDKTQSAREDREAADVVAVWRGQVGRLRSAVAAAKAAGKGPTLRVPEISENMQIQTAKMVPTAPKPCIVCGLKREERISKVDYDVEDSFGEWWAEHWGHKACKNFWVQHEQMLRQR